MCSIVSNDQPNQSDVAAHRTDMIGFLKAVHHDSVFEIRSIKCPDRRGGTFRRTASGIFNSIEAAIQAIEELEKLEPPAIYVSVNSVSPALLGRAKNRIVYQASSTTSDADIIRRTNLIVDIDPVRPAGISSTETEMREAIQMAEIIRHDLRSLGWPEPILGMSGNGATLIYSIDLPNDDSTKCLIQDCLKALGGIYSTETISIDQSVFSAGQIMKLLGTVARKGDDLIGEPGVEDRPHRRSWAEIPAEYNTVPIELIQTLAARKPTEEPAKGTSEYSEENFQIDRWLSKFNIPVDDPTQYKGGRRWKFNGLPCLCKNAPSGHGNDGSAFILELASGALAAGCMHDRCTWNWQDFRQANEPGCYDAKAVHETVDLSGILAPSVHTTSEIPENSEVKVTCTQNSNSRQSIPNRLPFKPFPVECLPSHLRKFIADGAKCMCCDPSFLALPLLTGLGAAIGNSLALIVKHNWVVPPILWTVIVAESGSTKSPPFRQALTPLYRRQKRLTAEFDEKWSMYEIELEKYERDRTDFRKSKDRSQSPPEAPVKPICSRCLLSDTTIEALGARLAENPRGILCDNHELSGWFGSFNRYSGKTGSDEASWLKFYNAEYVVIDRRNNNRPLIIDRASVFLTGTIQPGILRKHLSVEHRESGLASRLLFAMPPRVQKKWNDFQIDVDSENQIAAIVDQLFQIGMRELDGDLIPTFITMDSDAKQLFVRYYDRHSDEQNKLHGDLYAAYSKLEEVAARLALVIHAVRWATGEIGGNELLKIDAKSMAIGIELCEWFKQEAKRVYSLLHENIVASENRKLLDWLDRQEEPVSPAEVYKSLRRSFDSAEEIERLLEQFVKSGQGAWVEYPPTGKGGRPTRKYRHHVYTEPRTPEIPEKTEVVCTEVA